MSATGVGHSVGTRTEPPLASSVTSVTPRFVMRDTPHLLTGTNRGFAGLVRDLRASVGESQAMFAARLSVSRSLIGNVETGTLPSRTFVSALVAAFPDRDVVITDAYGRVDEARTAHAVTKPRSVLQRRVDVQIDSGRLLEAAAAIRYELTSDDSREDRLWLLERLAQVQFLVGREDEGLYTMTLAVDACRPDNVHYPTSKHIALQTELASRLQRRDDFAAAQNVLDAGLIAQPAAAALWHRKGIVHWYAHGYCEAYACLMTALKHGHPLRRIVHARGQVLAEWGSHSAAILDLTNAVDDPHVTPVAAAYARSTRAFAQAKLGDWQSALEQWQMAEVVTPDNAWLHYFRATCYIDHQEYDLAEAGFRRALQCRSPCQRS